MDKKKINTLRQVLNAIFMLGAVVGLILYFTHQDSLGTYIILAAIVVKFIECVLRMLK